MATGVSSSLKDEEDENFLHIYKLVVGIGTDAVRDKFDGLFQPSSLVSTLKTEEVKIRTLGKNRRLTSRQIDILFPSTGATSSKEYDISLMVCLIRNFKSGKPPINGFDELPLSIETSMEADLARIKFYRNKVAHVDSDKITTTDYKIIWKDLVDAIVRLGGTKYKHVCDELEQTKLSKNAINDLRQEIAELQEDTNQNFQQFRHDIGNQLDTKVGLLDEMLKDTTKDIIAKLEELEKEEKQLFSNMTNVDTTQQQLTESVSGLKGEKIKINKRLSEIKTEQDDLRGKLDQSNLHNLELGIKMYSLQTDQQQMQSKIDTLDLQQNKTTASDIAGKERLKGLQVEVESLQKDKERLQEKFYKLEQKREDAVPENIKEQIKRKLDEWKVKDKNFICTRAYEEVLEKCNYNSCVTVTGSSGSGKSAIVRHVSLLLSKEKGFTIIIVSNPVELKTYYMPGKKTLFVLDDVCGKFTANKRQIDDWYSMIDVVNQVSADDSCKLLLSCRLQVFKDTKFSELRPFKSCECNITSQELCLTTTEKKLFVKTYLNIESIEVDIFSMKNDLFPFLCESFPTEKSCLDIEKYFNSPYRIYQRELDALRVNGKYKLCGLCLCIMFNNQIKENFFSRLTKDFREIVKDACEYCGLNRETSAIRIREELDTLDKTYISKHDGVYEVYHDKLFDFMAYYFGHMMTQCFIDHADSAFLRERFIWKMDIDGDENLIENIIYLEDDYLPSYIDRMISDWSAGKVSDVFYNINMKSDSFREKFLECLKGIDKIQATQLANMKDVFRKDYASGNTPLIISCLDGYYDLLKWLLKHTANVSDRRTDGSSPLYMACQKNYVNIVNILLENNAEVNSCTVDGVSPLGIACYFHGNLQIVSALLKKNADVNFYKFKKNNMTPLFMACQKNFFSTAKELLKHNADPNICLNDGMTALLYACQNGNTDMARLLIQYKANPNTEMRDGDTPLFSVSRMGFKDIVEILLANGADYNKCLHSKESIEQFSEINQQSLESDKHAWFVDAMTYGSSRTVAYIKTKSADYAFDVFAGSSPLHAACFMGHLEISKLLIEKLLSADIKKKDGTTPLFYACEIGHSDIVGVLLKKGADPSLCTYNRGSPLSIAEVNGNAEVLSMLQKHNSCQ